MARRTRATAHGAPAGAHTQDPVQPKFPALKKLPSTPEELFHSLASTVTTVVSQPAPKGTAAAKKQQYALPWAGFEGWRDARRRLEHFEKANAATVKWVPFNGTSSNDGPMSLNAYPGRAFIERVTNEGDSLLELKAMSHDGPMPSSPASAAEDWFGLGAHALVTGPNDDIEQLAKGSVTVRAFVGDPNDPKDCVLDARDYGIGLTATEMPNTILSLNRGNKKSKAYLTGKHGQGASSTFQYSDLTLIASRKVGSSKVAFTLVEGQWDTEDGRVAKTPTYRYLTLNGQVPEVELPDDVFSHGTLVRHIGYLATGIFQPFGQDSLYGLLMRSLAEPLFPVWLERFNLRDEPRGMGGYPTFKGYRRFGRVIRGSVTTLERARAEAALTSPDDAQAGEDDGGNEQGDEDRKTRILHRASEVFRLPRWDFGGRVGEVELGQVQINYWVAHREGRSSNDVLRNWVDPDKTIIMTLDGQTHAEESRAIVTGQTGAKLWAVGRYMVVQIDCNGLDPRAKYEMFTSTREHAKETPIKKMILEELVRRLTMDRKLEELNVRLAAADIKRPQDDGKEFSALIKKYLKASGVSFEQLTRKVERWVDAEEDAKAPVKKAELPPIASNEPPTFVRWRLSGTVVKLHPGQRYSYVFETDAGPSYWNPVNAVLSKIKVTAATVRYVGAGEMAGGRVRCHFECPLDVTVGTTGFIQVQLDYATGQSLNHLVPVEIIEKPAPRQRKRGEPSDVTPDADGDSNKTIKVKVRKRDFTEVEIPVVRPMPVTKSDTTWATLNWPHDPSRVGFSVRQLSGKVHLYYNAEFPPFLDLKRKMSKRSLEEEFVRRYEMKLVLHTIFTLNYEFVDEDDFSTEELKKLRNLLCATAESLALATKAEIEVEAKIKSEDATPLETIVASDLSSAALPAQMDGAAG